MNSLKRVRTLQIELEFDKGTLVFRVRGKPEHPEKNL